MYYDMSWTPLVTNNLTCSVTGNHKPNVENDYCNIEEKVGCILSNSES